jgi:hypothetical protein
LPAGQWTFENNATNIANNNYGNGVNNGGTYVAGRDGDALSLDGISNYVNLGNPSAMQIVGEITISAWVNPDSLHPFAPILTKTDDTENLSDGFGLFLNESRILSAFAGGANVLVDDDDPTSNPPIPARPGAWSHLALTFDGTTASFYINGQFHSSVEPVDPNLTINGAPVNLGTLASEINHFPYHGHIADVRVYDTALDATEIRDLFTSTPVFKEVDSLGIGIPDTWFHRHQLSPWNTPPDEALNADGFTVRQKYFLNLNPNKQAKKADPPLLRVYTPLEKVK